MSNMILAKFLMPVARLHAMEADMRKRASVSDTPRLEMTAVGNGGITTVYGPAQQVMFLIGYVAEAGEDALYTAHAI